MARASRGACRRFTPCLFPPRTRKGTWRCATNGMGLRLSKAFTARHPAAIDTLHTAIALTLAALRPHICALPWRRRSAQ